METACYICKDTIYVGLIVENNKCVEFIDMWKILCV